MATRWPQIACVEAVPNIMVELHEDRVAPQIHLGSGFLNQEQAAELCDLLWNFAEYGTLKAQKRRKARRQRRRGKGGAFNPLPKRGTVSGRAVKSTWVDR